MYATSSPATILYAMGRVNDAVESLRKALDLNPEYSGALNSLGFIYAQEDLDAVRALDLCKKAVRLRPRNPAYLDSLGWAQYKSGTLGEARDTVRKALDLSPGNAEIASHMRTIIDAIRAKR